MKYLTVLAATVMGLALGAATLHSQTFNNLYSFSALQGTSPKTNFDGQAPYGNLVLSGGTLYGTAYSAGTNGTGTVFAINTNGAGMTILHSFAALVSGTNADGANPDNGLVLSGGILYGTTLHGGALGYGTVFAISTSGTNFSTLHVFTNGLDGALPHAGLVMLNNTLYGTTSGTGSNNSFGTIYSIQTNGLLALLHTFNTNIEGGLARAGLTPMNNVLYGTTYMYGSNGFGSVFSVNPGTSFSVLHNFVFASEGGNSEAALVPSGNTLFGATSAGGASGWGTVFSLSGTTLGVLHTFAGDVEGGKPIGGLAVLGNTLYGTTQQGGSVDSYGTVYSVRTNGVGFFVLHTFTGPDGFSASGGLLLSAKNAYGTTTFGGSNGANGGTIYSVTVPILTITNLAISGSDILFSAVDGLSNGTYSLLTSSNAGSPFSQWKSVATTVLSSNGPFTITATNTFTRTNPAAFYILQSQ
jgi:uncharacterized repeat protein (TIGR03803 family)